MLDPTSLRKAIPVLANAFMKRLLVGLPSGTQLNQRHIEELAASVEKSAMALVKKRPTPRILEIDNKKCAAIFAECFVEWSRAKEGRGIADMFEKEVGERSIPLALNSSDDVVMQAYAALGASVFIALCGNDVAKFRDNQYSWNPLVSHFKALLPHASKDNQFDFLAIAVSFITFKSQA